MVMLLVSERKGDPPECTQPVYELASYREHVCVWLRLEEREE